MTPEKFAELMARAKSALEREEQEKAIALEQMIASEGVKHVDLTKAGIDEASLETDSGQDAAVDVIREVIASLSGSESSSSSLQVNISGNEGSLVQYKPKDPGVARDIDLNPKQQDFCDAVFAGEDCCLIGPAGTGKTTTMRKTTQKLVSETSRLPRIAEQTKWLKAGLHGAAILSYTRKAVNNIRHAVVEELKPHTLTLHKLLEFAPVLYEIEDPASPGEFKRTMRFEPKRNSDNPLPAELVFIAFEESSMIGTDLYSLLQDAMPHAHQEVFLGDIQQLPPIFGSAVLGYKLLQLRCIELTEVYRQALDNPILALAWKILEGDSTAFSSRERESYKVTTPAGKEVTRQRWLTLDAWNKVAYDARGQYIGELKFQPWQKKLTSEDATNICGAQFCKWIEEGYYNPDEDMILLPFNKAFGTIELNKKIQQHLGLKREAIVHEVIAGFNKHYLAIGDRVLYDKEDAFITAIHKNPSYLGRPAMPASQHLDRWGCMQERLTEAELLNEAAENAEMSEEALERLMADAANGSDERVQAASHEVTVRFAYSDEDLTLDKAAQVNNLLGGNAITVHKAQGSEYERGFFVMHHTHATMNQRELLYTAPTRFKKFLHIICEADTFEKGIRSQRIVGNTLAEKAEFFKGKHEAGADEAKLSQKAGGEYIWRSYDVEQSVENDVELANSSSEERTALAGASGDSEQMVATCQPVSDLSSHTELSSVGDLQQVQPTKAASSGHSGVSSERLEALREKLAALKQQRGGRETI